MNPRAIAFPAAASPFDFAPAAGLLLLGAALAVGPLWWIWRRHAGGTPAVRAAARLQALGVLTLCLTFDLVLFGAFTRLTDSGLGCPDWPGCYGSNSPLGAQAQIDAAQRASPNGPVSQGKAWIEMTHRYLASGVGALITALAAMSWWAARRATRDRPRGGLAEPPDASPLPPPTPPPLPPASSPLSPPPALPVWTAVTLVWVCLQGLFGALTVTLKLHPLVVTAHLLGGMGLLALLAVQVQLQARETTGPRHERGERREPHQRHRGWCIVGLPRALRRFAIGLAVLSGLQIALGGWVSTHYAVLACNDFPRCQGSWWPAMDFRDGFALLRGLGAADDGTHLPFAALTAIHYTHRLLAYLVLITMGWFAWRLWRSGVPGLRRWAAVAASIGAWQLASGIGNVVLDWPLGVAVAHTAGAAAWVVLLASVLAPGASERPGNLPASRGAGTRLPKMARSAS